MLRKFIDGSCKAIRSMLCLASLPLLKRPCWQPGDLLRFCCHMASALCSLFALYIFIFHGAVGSFLSGHVVHCRVELRSCHSRRCLSMLQAFHLGLFVN